MPALLRAGLRRHVGPSPAWLAERLEAAGVRPINNIVDVTNYVMLEMGQPMHAFDLDASTAADSWSAARGRRNADDARRRRARADPEMLVIADARRAVAIGGVMGGRDSEIGAARPRMVLESAYFQPAVGAAHQQALGLKTEASTRFERGGDIKRRRSGIARAAALLEQIGAAAAIGPIVDRYPSPRAAADRRRCARRGSSALLGTDVPAADVPRILTPLGFASSPRRDGWTVTVPSFRVDVTREVDLVEEVGRHYGFDRLPADLPGARSAHSRRRIRGHRARPVLRELLTASGLLRIDDVRVHRARRRRSPSAEAGFEPAAIANPLSEKFAVLRPSLLPGLIDSCAHNRRRGRKDVRLFETGSRFTSAPAKVAQRPRLVRRGRPRPLVGADARRGLLRRQGRRRAALRRARRRRIEFAPPTIAVPRARSCRDRPLPSTAARVARRRSVSSCRRSPTRAAFQRAKRSSSPSSTSTRCSSLAAGDDLRARVAAALSVDRARPLDSGRRSLACCAVRGTIRSAAPSTLSSVVEFDRYHGQRLPEGHLSLSLRLTFRSPDRTLTDEEVQMRDGRDRGGAAHAHGAEQRRRLITIRGQYTGSPVRQFEEMFVAKVAVATRR